MPTDDREKPDVLSTNDSPRGHSATTGDTPETADSRPEQETARRIPMDLVSGLFLLAVVAVFVGTAGGATLDWLFPLTLSAGLGIIGAYLTIRGLLGFGDKTDTLLPLVHGRGVDVFVFALLTVVYVGLARIVGFWIMSILMIFAAAVYLDTVRSKRRMALAAAIAVIVAIVAYVLLLKVFYVPLPRARFLPF